MLESRATRILLRDSDRAGPRLPLHAAHHPGRLRVQSEPAAGLAADGLDHCTGIAEARRSGCPTGRREHIAVASLGATLIALVLGTLAAFAVQRFRFFGRQTISFLLVLPIALPGVVTGIALRTSFVTLGIEFGLLTIIIGHATFCVVIAYNNVIARLRRLPRSPEEASADLGARCFTTFRRVTLPGIGHGLLSGGVARVRAVLRRDHRDELHGGRRHADDPDVDPERDPASRTSSPSSTSSRWC